MHSSRALSIIVIGILLAVPFAAFIFSDQSDAAAGTDEDPILILPGQTWRWTPSFPSGLTPSLTVSASATAMPTNSSTYTATSGWASITSDGKSVEVSAPSDSSGKYYVRVKATTTQPTQVAYSPVILNVQAKMTGTGGTCYAALGGAQDPFSVSASIPATFSITDYGTLTNGSSKVSINANTGAITVNPVSGDAGTYTLKVLAVAKDNPTNSVSIMVTLQIAQQLSFESSPETGIIVNTGV